MKTKRFFVLSTLSLILCLSMFIGSTFAWFTDYASTGVNKIQSGTLDVALEMSTDGGITWTDAENKTLQFHTADGRTDNILWEPGCTYELPLLRVVNSGSLALKYRVVITGIQGDALLNEAIEWTINNAEMDTYYSLAPNAHSEIISIRGHMPPWVGNTYQGLSMDGISITVHATQDTVEYDSYDNLYDAPASQAEGTVQIWRGNRRIGSHADLQSAVAAAADGDTLKLTGNIKATGLASVSKNLTIDGRNYRITRENYNGTILQLESGSRLTISDLTIDGGASAFRIDFTQSYPAVPEDTQADDPRVSASAIVSRGELLGRNLHFTNNCTELSGQAPLKLLQGSATLENCSFIHNYGHSQGGAVYIGEAFAQGQTDYTLGAVVFRNCDFTENYTRYGNGGAVYARYARSVEFYDCDFRHNMAASYCAGGGAVLFSREGIYATDAAGLTPMQEIFEDCLFESNYSGNDGFAIDNECGELTVINCSFIGNIGLSGNSAVGTISEMHYTDTILDTRIENCLFQNNQGAAAVYGDHSSPHNIVMTGCTFTGNQGSLGILLYCSTMDMSDCRFIDEQYSTAVIDTRAYNYVGEYAGYPPTVVNLTNISVTGSDIPAGLLIRKQGHDLNRETYTVNLYGSNAIDIHVWDRSCLNVYGTLNGSVYSDGTTPVSNVTIPGTLNGTWQSNPNNATVIFQYAAADGRTVNRYSYLEKGKTYTAAALQDLHGLTKEGCMLHFFTDSGCSTPWNFSVSGHTTIYTLWIPE